MRRSLRRFAPAAILLALFTLAAGCAGGEPPVATTGGPADCIEDFDAGTDYFPEKVAFTHASSVAVTYAGHYKVVTVTPPTGADPLRFVLVQCGAPEPDLDGDLAGATAVQIPVRRVVTLTTTNLPHFDLLGAVDRITGVGTAAYVSTPSVREHIAAEGVRDFADAQGQPDLEALVSHAPDLMIMDGFGDALLDDVRRYTEAGVPTVVNADFNEQTLLGRAEWIKFTALLLNAEAAAEAAFGEIAQAYTALTERVAAVQARPSVLVNTPYEGTWFVPGGASYFANAIREAGGAYAFGEDSSTFSLQLDFETVVDAARDADVWLQAGSVHGTLEDLRAQDERFAIFAAFGSGAVWAYDKATTPEGGNAVFEVAYTRADLFLADLVHILHPELLPDHEPVFYGRVPAAN